MKHSGRFKENGKIIKEYSSMRILLAPAAGGVGLGPLTNVLAVAEEAHQLGHTVAILCKKSWQPMIRQRGIETYIAPEPNAMNNIIKPPPFKLSDVVIGLGWAEEDYIRASIQAEREAITSFKADVVVSMLQLTAPIAAAVEKIPSVAIFSWADGPKFTSPLYEEHDTYTGWESNYNIILDEYDLPPIADICDLAYQLSEIRIAPTIPELQPELLSILGVHFVGYLLSQQVEIGELPSIIKSSRGENSSVFVYLSPGDIKPDHWIPTVIEAFEGTGWQVWVTLAPLSINPKSLPQLENVHFYKYLPGSSAIASSNLVISHGGANIVTNALLAGVPQIVYADRYAERDYNGRGIERLGAGMNCPTEAFTARHLRNYARELISHKHFSERASQLGAQIRQFGGARRAIEIIEDEL